MSGTNESRTNREQLTGFLLCPKKKDPLQKMALAFMLLKRLRIIGF
jgi:hypothetical protein